MVKTFIKERHFLTLRYFKIKIKECDIQTVAMIRELQDDMQDDGVINVLSKPSLCGM